MFGSRWGTKSYFIVYTRESSWTVTASVLWQSDCFYRHWLSSYCLFVSQVDGDIPTTLKRNAHELILDFIRSRPPLKPVSLSELCHPSWQRQGSVFGWYETDGHYKATLSFICWSFSKCPRSDITSREARPRGLHKSVVHKHRLDFKEIVRMKIIMTVYHSEFQLRVPVVAPEAFGDLLITWFSWSVRGRACLACTVFREDESKWSTRGMNEFWWFVPNRLRSAASPLLPRRSSPSMTRSSLRSSRRGSSGLWRRRAPDVRDRRS